MNPLLLIPAFNEEPYIERLVYRAKAHLPDVLVIDDGSSDTTAALAEGAGATVHRLRSNKGKGEALKAGFQYAAGQGREWVLTMDGDGQHNPDDISNFLPLLTEYDLILGNRMDDAGRIPLMRRIANLFSSLLVSLLCFRRIRDSQSGFRAYRVDLLRQVPLRSSRYDLETEVLIKAVRKGFRIGHCRVQTIYAGEASRFRTISDSLRFFVVIARSFLWW